MRPALPALLIGAVFIALSPIFVRLSDVGPTASAFWRVALAAPLLWPLLLLSRQAGTPISWKLALAAGLAFAGDLVFWHWSIRFTSLACQFDLLLEDRLAREVVFVRPRAAGGAGGALAGLRLDALVAARERLLVRVVRGARFLDCLVEIGGAVLRSRGQREREQCDEDEAFHAYPFR